MKKSILCQDRIDKLNSLKGWLWEVDLEEWNSNYEILNILLARPKYSLLSLPKFYIYYLCHVGINNLLRQNDIPCSLPTLIYTDNNFTIIAGVVK